MNFAIIAFFVGAIILAVIALYFVNIGKDKEKLEQAKEFKKGVYAKEKKEQELKDLDKPSLIRRGSKWLRRG